MKNCKRIVSLVVSVAMMLSMMAVTSFAANGETNVKYEVNKTEAAPGDEITVTISNKAMNVSTFTCGIQFDTDVLECTSVAGFRGNRPGIWVKDEWEDWVQITEVSTPANAMVEGKVGFGKAASTSAGYLEGKLAVVTFTVKAEASGTTDIVLYEDTAGTDAFKSSAVDTTTITIEGEEPECEHINTEIRDAKDATYTEEGYTGDTYCKDCGEKIATGTVTDKLVCEHANTEIRGAVDAT